MTSNTILLVCLASMLPAAHSIALPISIAARSSEPDHRGIPKGAIIGIAVSVVVIAIILMLFRFGAIMSMRRKQDKTYVQQIRSRNTSPTFDYDRSKYSSSPAIPLLIPGAQTPAASSSRASTPPGWIAPQEPPPAYTPMANSSNSSASAGPIP